MSEPAETDPENRPPAILTPESLWKNLEDFNPSIEQIDTQDDGFYTNPLFDIEHSLGFKHIETLLSSNKIDKQQ